MKTMKLLFLFLFGALPMLAQESETPENYYYYNGKKVPLILNEEKVVVSIPKECTETDERVRSDVHVLGIIRDGSFDIFVISKSDYETLTTRDYWNEDAKSVIISSSYFTEDNFEVYATPYLDVKLKEEQDVDLLASYAETYKLKIVENVSSMPLWYILALTPESEKSPLVCANELYESGKFAHSVPDLQSCTEVGYFEGTVTNQDGQPIQGANVCIRRNTEAGFNNFEYYATTDANGHYKVTVESDNNFSQSVIYFMTVKAEGYPVYDYHKSFNLDGSLSNYFPKEITLWNRINFIKDQMATIILPEAPDPTLGRYYRYDHLEGPGGHAAVFALEEEPKANVPYVIFPNSDFSIDLTQYDLDNLPEPTFAPLVPDDTYSLYGFYGVYTHYASLDCKYILDDTPDCCKGDFSRYIVPRIGPFRAYLYANLGTFTVFSSNVSDTSVVYRPMIEDGKVWKVGSTRGVSDGVVKMVDYYYLNGDTIIDGKTCKKMMCKRYVSPEHPDYDVLIEYPLLRNEGAWYEEDKKVYVYDTISNQFRMKYDFSSDSNDTLMIDNHGPFVIGPKRTGGLAGFKGVYRDIIEPTDEGDYFCTTWLEGVGGIESPLLNTTYAGTPRRFMVMSCTVGDEVIYLNDDYEDGASIDAAGARKDRFDFVHIVKPRPKAPSKQEEIMVKAPMRKAEEPIYGEYNELQLDINLNPLADAYMVSITNETGKAVYEKAINAGSIVGLNIDISAYAKGRYTVTMENSLESFTGEFEVQTTGIEEVIDNNKVKASNTIFNLQGQRISSLQKGLNIVNGRKVVVK